MGKKIVIASAAIIVLSFIVGIYFYNILPDRIATHWDSQGNVNGYMTKFWGVFLVPLIMIGLSLLLVFLPKLDPFKKNYTGFQKYYDAFVLIMLLFLFYVFLLSLIWNFKQFNFFILFLPAFSVLFFFVGILMEKSKRNWFVGIRTPWTLSSDKVWDKTHKLGGFLFKLSAIIVLAGIFFPKYAIWFVLVPILASALISFIYSYLVYRKK